MEIVIIDGYTSEPGKSSWECIDKLGNLTVYDKLSSDQIIHCAGNADILLVTARVKITEALIEQFKSLKYIGILATGYNNIDIDAAKKHGIAVTNIPDYSTPSVAQLTFALLLELCCHVGEHSLDVHNGEWEKNPDNSFWRYPFLELFGKTMGVIGFGGIGSWVARIARSFGMKVIVYSRTVRNEQGIEFVTFDQILERADVLTLHCPLTDTTRNMIDQDGLSRMKQGAFLINTARGPLIDENAVRIALETGKLAGLAVDVTDKEPLLEGSPLFKAPNCIVTPHIGWATAESRERLLNITAQNIEAFINGEPVNVVN